MTQDWLNSLYDRARARFRRTPPHLRGRTPVDCGEGKAPEDGHWFAGPAALVRTPLAKPRPEVAYRDDLGMRDQRYADGTTRQERLAMLNRAAQGMTPTAFEYEAMRTRAAQGPPPGSPDWDNYLRQRIASAGMAVQSPRHVTPLHNLSARPSPFDEDE